MKNTFHISSCLCSLLSLVLFAMGLVGCAGQQSPISFYRKPLMTLDSLIGGTPLTVISAGMGHTSERTTRIYLAQLDHNIIDKANRKIIDLQ